ncbi:hypothetical protein NW754_002843 [Fusarium falciforme]|uniref:Uncharacterized protein n=1 Tax=Fusarium falciforme TaxID=195108 RepID=A0A9W8QZX3_9HYPO|nr:Hypothetical protein NCS54_01426700 [Fusarium falciforme]KAJ4172641.1 hypothetical protein NW754_002843 [Fusarium falciforme]KAJ4181501.1 hypothetical protein NW755_011038 [Fusarium falciforme]KAJ4249704.1 hypothetical protein NW757_007732 [Fusarium falciforme]WAO96588.1 Hypothetical protein NCS54_01426700 [Fusarium falciforme]
MPKLETHNGYPLWRYVPSLPAAIVFVVIFGILTIGHAWKMFRHRMWFCIPFVVGGIFEIIGYAARAVAYNSTGALMPYVLQSALLLLAPILFAASLYMTLARVVRAVKGAPFSIIAPRWLTRIFVFGDVFSFIVQASGAGLRVQAGNNPDIDPNLGSNIIVGGLIFQIAIFGVFIATALIFNSRFRRHVAGGAVVYDVPWQESLNMLYVTSMMIMVRNIFRVVEYAMGSDGYLLSVEWGVYVFDAALMTLTMAWFFWRYPSQLKQAIKANSEEVELESGR